MTPAHTFPDLSDMLAALQSWAHATAPAGTESFDSVAIFSLACYLLFAVLALFYALKTWAEKVMFTSLAAGTAASLLLHLSLRHTPSYAGEGALWKFVSMSQYLPWAVLSICCMYALYRMGTYLRPTRR